MRLSFSIFLFLCMVCSSCSEKKHADEDSATFVSSATDAVETPEEAPKARAIAVSTKTFQAERAQQPREIPLQNNPRNVRARVNRYPVRSKTESQKTEALVTLTPGKNGMPEAKSKTAGVHIEPVRLTEPVTALPPRMKDAAIYDIQYLDVDQGLISSYIRTIMSDRFGNLWFGTSYGVSRYDGNTFIHFTSKSGLTDDSVISILEDSSGDLWFGTHKGVTRYDGNYFYHYTAEQGFGDVTVRDILEDGQGNLWFGTTEGVIRYDRNSDPATFTRYTTEHGLIDNHILCMLEDDRGYIWFGTFEGLTRYDGNGFTNYTTTAGLKSNKILSMYKDSHGDLWFGMDAGVSRYDGTSFTHYYNSSGLFDEEVVAILEDQRGNLWFGTSKGLSQYVSRYDEGTMTHYTTEEGLSNDRVRCLWEDREGNLWFGTGGGGINRLKGAGFAHFTTEEGLTDNGVVFIHEDRKGSLWLGTDKGLSRYLDNKFVHYTTREGLISNDVHCALEDRAGDMWFGTKRGLSRFNGSSFSNYNLQQGLPDTNIISLLQDSKGMIWMGTGSGMCRFAPDTPGQNNLRLTVEDGLAANKVDKMIEDRSGKIWMATEEGLNVYDPAQGGQLRRFTKADGLLSEHIVSLLEDSDGQVWIGTAGGLNLYRPQAEGKQFADYTTQDGLSNNYIWSILEDREKNIWVSTEKGITLLKPNGRNQTGINKGGPPTFDFFIFDKGDGLKRLDFHANSVCLDLQNRLWWGSEGATMLDLTQFKLATRPPQNLMITHIEVNQQFVDFRRLNDDRGSSKLKFEKALATSFDSVVAYYNYPAYMDLPHDLNHLTFHFSAIDWGRPHRIEYQYYMEGLEETWSNTGMEPRVNYRNLSSGHYVFKVRARGDAQEWSEAFEYPFHIRPVWYASGWAFAIYILLVLGALYSVFYFWKRRWLLRNELLREQAESSRMKKREIFRSQLYTNLTHEFRTPLNVILGMSEQIESDPDRHLREGLPLIQRNGEQLLRLINQLLDLAKLEDRSFQLHLQRGDIVSYLHYYTDSFRAYARSKGVTLHFETEVKKVIMDYDPEQVGHILTNLISNAVKFTSSGGHVTVRVDRSNADLNIEVADTGIGIDKADLSQIFERFYQVDSSSTRSGEGTGIGLAHTRELVHLMEGKIDVNSAPGQGTTFRIHLPIRISENTELIVPAQESAAEIEEKARIIAPSFPVIEEISEIRHPAEPDRKALPRVLIVEDNHDSMTYLVSCLADRYEIDLANNGQMGIEKALQHIPDLIISDVMMPDKNGYDLCRFLKNDERTSHIPVILLTAKADRESKIKGLEYGADAYLYKPFHKRELLVRLEAMMDKQRKLLDHFAQKFKNGLVEAPGERESQEKVMTKEEIFVERIREIVELNYADENFSMMDICEEISMSRSQLYRKMKAITNISPSDFLRTYRLEKARILLKTTDLNVTQVAYATGYKDLSHFSKSFQEVFGYPPSDIVK
ncbi:hybrid sensor histidine kinase/response regulator transcription factor [Flavilitoribacter nigricans]|nr:two-component regulator propeller domain-containing protein [Flavilitoribacter nigricans]